jgi:predicted HAD superfamily Cof-like phosphohydrolase
MNVLENTVKWFDKAFPNPTPKNVQTQMGVHIEEVREMILELESVTVKGSDLLEAAQIALHNLAEHLKNSQPGMIHVTGHNLQGFLDSLADQLVTVTGVALAHNMDIVGALDEVNRSNFSKFVDGQPTYHPETQKLLKGPDYSEPQLGAFLMR